MSAALAHALPPESQALPTAANDAAPAPHSLLRFITCGSVDDGKSTLIGRLLFEAGAVPDDVSATLAADSAAFGNAGGEIDYSLLVDGLQAEREQGITIDVAYRYFATPRRSFIVADTPGHEQYTRNMATGASGADLAIILIDARKGVLPQTRRHSLIVSLVGVRHVVVAINKIDLIGFNEAAVRKIEADYRAAVAGLGFEMVTVIPVSAREGDNIARPSLRTPWHAGPTLLGCLETVQATPTESGAGFVMPVQWVNRPDDRFRGFSGTVASGGVRPGDRLVALPSGESARVTRIVTFDGDLPSAGPGQAVTLTLDRDIDISRGDVLVASAQPGGRHVRMQDEIVARIFVSADRRIAPGDSLLVQVGAASAAAQVTEVLDRTDIESFADHSADCLAVNDLGRVRLRLDRPLALTPYQSCRELGALILVDRLTNATAALGVLPGFPQASGKPGDVLDFRDAARSALERNLGPQWRQEIAPAASWRLASAALLGVTVALLTANPVWGITAAVLDAAIRPLLRPLHREAWAVLRRRFPRQRDAVSDGGGI